MNKSFKIIGAALLVAALLAAQQFAPVTPTLPVIAPNVGGAVYTVLIATNPAVGSVCATYNLAYLNYQTGDEFTCVGGYLLPNPQRLRTGATANTDMAGFITLAAGVGSYTFANTGYASAPVCTATDSTAVAATKASATSTVLSVAGTGTDVLAYTCVVRT